MIDSGLRKDIENLELISMHACGVLNSYELGEGEYIVEEDDIFDFEFNLESILYIVCVSGVTFYYDSGIVYFE